MHLNPLFINLFLIVASSVSVERLLKDVHNFISSQYQVNKGKYNGKTVRYYR